MKPARVVITGIGVISSIGTGREDFWKALCAGTSGISEISGFDTSEFTTHLGGEIKNFDPALFLSPKRINVMGRASQLAIAAAKLALGDSKLSLDQQMRSYTGVALGTTLDIITSSIPCGNLTCLFERRSAVVTFQDEINFSPLKTPKAIEVFPMSIVSSISFLYPFPQIYTNC